MKKIWLSPPHMSGKERLYVEEAFVSNWVAPLGPNVSAFEEQLTNYSGRASVALNSGTAALHLALRLLNIKTDDFVFCQSLTFAGCAFPILYEKAIPVFIDSEASSWNMDPDLLEQALKQYAALGKKPKAIIVVHIYGMPADMQRISKIAKEYKVPLIEDAAEALGSTYNNIPCGGFGDFSIYSFNGNKIITTSGGGALLCANETMIEKARKLASQAKEPAAHYEHVEVGYNYRMSNICAGIGRAQMQVLNDRVEKRRSIFKFYKEWLQDIDCIEFQKENFQSYSNRWLTVASFQLGSNLPQKIRMKLDEHHIESRPVWKPMHLQPVFKDAPSFVNGVSDRLFETGICLPSGSALMESDLKQITSVIKKIARNETVAV